MKSGWKKLSVAVLVVAILAGGAFGDRVLALSDDARRVLRTYTELLQVAHDSYGDEVSYKQLVESSISGMLRTLDPHTNFLSTEAYSSMRERQKETFYGLGILVGMRNGQLTVITPIEGTPASRMGLLAGDVIAAIEGESTQTMSLGVAVRLLKGPKGTKVTIQIVRAGLDQPLEVTITRDEIPQNTVRYAYMIAPETAYIAIFDFNRGTGREVAEALERLREAGMQRLILDLRGNGGGLLDQAISVSDQFLDEGAEIVSTRGRTRNSHQKFFATGQSPALDIPLVVLVGRGTASAAEIVSGAIQDHDMGLVVGTPTWGKGLVQTVYSLPYNAGLALTTAKYYTPSGRLIQRDYTSYFDYQIVDEDNGGLTPTEVAQNENRQAFSTDLGREVYGGGGITPDVIVEPLSLSPEIQYLLSQNSFFDFAVQYMLTHTVEDRDWVPQPELLSEFSTWLLDQKLITEQEVGDMLGDLEAREMMKRYLHAEIFNSAFGIEARFEALAPGDPQIVRALELLGEASDLLARRRNLEKLGEPEVASAAAVG
ncbi:MAG: PDZ domain-containing protein [Acidobacteria bacterium]|nr:PDZ domain-containing protein [Acidobacteriota bacterium]